MNLSPDQKATIKKLWAAGLSVIECGREIGLEGDPVEVRAIVSGALTAEKKAPAPAVDPRPNEAGSRSRSNVRGGARTKIEPEEPEAFVESGIDLSFEIPVEQRKNLMQLTAKTCRWPVGDPRSKDFYFCGGDAVEDEAYCRFHCRVAYNGHVHRRRPVAA